MKKTGYVCPDCEGIVSESVKVCPHCGREFERYLLFFGGPKIDPTEKSYDTSDYDLWDLILIVVVGGPMLWVSYWILQGVFALFGF